VPDRAVFARPSRIHEHFQNGSQPGRIDLTRSDRESPSATEGVQEVDEAHHFVDAIGGIVELNAVGNHPIPAARQVDDLSIHGELELHQ
jgi:hypothetical protein